MASAVCGFFEAVRVENVPEEGLINVAEAQTRWTGD